mgnify:CR=1 FL=1
MSRLEEWAVVRNGGDWDGYSAPELATFSLVGRVYDDPRHDPETGRFQDGHRIHTSPIVASEGRVVTTRSGTRYELGEASESYRTYLSDQGRELDPEQPVKVLTRDQKGSN